MSKVDREAWFSDEIAFAKQLGRGHRAELQVALRLMHLGLAVKLGELRLRRDTKEVPLYRDEADLEVEGGHLLEIKARQFAFTCPEDFPYETAFVGAKRRWDARTTSPCAVVLFSEPTKQFVLAPYTSRKQWTETKTHDSQRDFVETSYACPKGLLLPGERLFYHLQEWCPAHPYQGGDC